ncbi:22251_t:CDS:2 [Entrophospora sp. SA101]|nr:22245_t:CDS:2 [Entrophospora sp. SA101]CAJ0917537.1 22251_t:CDS:2 [Entrophospora sp. SA101]
MDQQNHTAQTDNDEDIEKAAAAEYKSHTSEHAYINKEKTKLI